MEEIRNILPLVILNISAEKHIKHQIVKCGKDGIFKLSQDSWEGDIRTKIFGKRSKLLQPSHSVKCCVFSYWTCHSIPKDKAQKFRN